MLTNVKKKKENERKNNYTKMRLAHCRTLFLLSHLVMTRGSFSITVIHLPKWIGYVKEIDDEKFFPPAFCFGTASIVQLCQQLKVVAGFCLCWVNCGLILLHSDLFSVSAPRKTWSAAGFILLSLLRPQPLLLAGTGALTNQTKGSKKVPWECVEKYLLFPEHYLFCT